MRCVFVFERDVCLLNFEGTTPQDPTKPNTQKPACVFITAVPITKLFAGGGGRERGEDMCYERLRAEANVN